MNKNILSIIYFFPPMGGSGVQRTLKFVKYMPKLGYTPVVETVKKGHNFAYDQSLLKEVPDEVRVYRSSSGETLWLRAIIEKIFAFKNIFKNKNENMKNTTNTNNKNKSEQVKVGLKDRIFKFIELNFFIPDSKIRWYKYAVKDVDNILKNEKIDCIFSSSYPYTVHLIALEAKKKTNLPWVADFRDPWVGNVFMTKEHSEKRKNKEKKLEAEVVKYADKVIMVTESICETYKKRYPQYKDKFVTITNGFDKADFKEIKAVEEKKFNICYSGILTKGQTPQSLVEALEKLYKEDSKICNDIKIKFIGYLEEEHQKLLKNSSIRENIEILPYMQHSKCISHMKGADINLMILPDEEESKGVFSGKIFDYIGAERPILGIMPSNGTASNLINNKKIGKSFDHFDVNGIYEFIKENYEKWKKGESNNTDAALKCNEFDRENLTKQLVELFDELLEES